MRIQSLTVLLLRTALIVVVGAAAAARADTYYVNRTCGNNAWSGKTPECVAPDGPKATIQAGINAAVNGDTVWVADGTYTGVGNRDLDFGGKLITVRSENGPENCIIDCQASETDPHRGFYFHSAETPAAVVQGVTIRNGYVDQDTPGRYGGGVYCGANSSPTLSNCTITGNSVYGMGGGVYCSYSSPTLSNCTIAGNSCNFMGAGVYCWRASPTLIDCTIRGNTADDWGAGVHCSESSPKLVNCTITDNVCIYGYGAGVCCEDWSSATVANCTIAGNSAHGGGGVYCYQSSPTLTNCMITGNEATWGYGYGGAVFCFAGANATLTNCTITSNTANYGGALFCEDSRPTLTNCILWGDDAYSGREIYLSAYEGTSTLTVSYGDVEGGQAGAYVEQGCNLIWGDGNIDQDPLFVNPDNGDYHLSSGSPCINAATNYAPDLPDEDIEGNPRIQQCRVDMGAYESPYPGTFEDCNENGEDDDCDIYEGTSPDCNQNHVPDECDLADGTSDDYDLNAVPDECDPDCNQNGVPDACDLDCATGNCASHPLGCGGSDDYDLNGVPDECEDCNENGIPDVCDLDCAAGNCAAHPLGCGASEDCNSNGAPDECDIADATSEDCQPNGVPDECDIADGTSEDENANGVPDECEAACRANELAKLLPTDGAPGDHFGGSLALSGDTAVIGAAHDDDNGTNSGSAYVFRYDGSTWVQEAKLLPSDGAVWDIFGGPVAVSGDTAVIGATGDDDNGAQSGSAYVFRYDGSDWVQEAKLLPSDGAPGDSFGYVAISGDTAVIGALGDDSAYVFRRDGSTWVQEAKLLGSGNFGEFVSISGDCAVIGAWWDDDNGQGSGSAYVFRYDGWTWFQEAKLLASDGAPDDNFGNGVAIFGDTVLVGGRGNDDNGTDSGSAYVFRYDGSNWVEEAKLLASDGAPYDGFGNSLALSGNIALITAYYDDDNGEGSGSAYVFRYDGSHWLEQAKLLPSDGAPGDGLGWLYNAAVSGDTAVVGAWGDDDNGENSGSAYVFRGLSDCNDNWVLDICDIAGGTSADCQPNGVPDECDIAAGTSADCNSNGIPDECDVVGVPPQSLLNPTTAAGDYFGWSVAAVGDKVLVGAPYDDTGASNAGAAYLFDGVTGQLLLTLPNPTPAANDCFGWSVAAVGDQVLVGAPYDDTGASNAGAAYLFDGVTGQLLLTLPNPTPAADDRFGSAVAGVGGNILVGTPYDDTGAGNAGAAYLFDGVTGQLLLTVLNPTPAAYDRFGYSVAGVGGNILVGTPYDDTGATDGGAAYLFDGPSGDLLLTFLNPVPASGDRYGYAVAAVGLKVLVGAPYDDTGATDAGAAYLYSVIFDCNNNDVPDECDIASGTSQDCQPNGVPDECDIASGTSQDANGDGIPDECVLAGDVNCDGAVNFGDINPFVLFLSNYGTWLETYPNCPPTNGDINGDGLYPSFGDINPFVALLSGS